MSTSQLVLMNPIMPNHAPLYPFLAHPPPQKKRPTAPLPPPPTAKDTGSPCPPPCGRRRSATTSAISAWAAGVDPGTPAPYSPRRSSAFSFSIRRASGGSTLSSKISAWAADVHPGSPVLYSPRRNSSTLGVSICRTSRSTNTNPPTSFTSHSNTPTTASKITPSMQDFKVDLTTIGYTSFFVHVPNLSPSHDAPVCAPPSPVKEAKRGLKSFKSLSSLCPSRRTRSRGPSSPLESPRARAQAKAAPFKTKKIPKYKTMRPAPLSNELALAQLLDGGSLEHHVNEYSRRQGKAGGAVKDDGRLVGVGDIYRDAEGTIWMDREEMQEYVHLLSKEVESPTNTWERFDSPQQEEKHRESVSSQDSDLSPQYAMKVDSDALDDLACFTRTVDNELRKPGMAILAIPSRSRRAAKHLHKPEFLLNVFPVPISPQSSGLRATLSSPRIAAFRTSPVGGKTRRRPAPLKLVPLKPASKCPVNPDQLRRDFLEDSFAPAPKAIHLRVPQYTLPSQAAPMVSTTNKPSPRPSLMNIRGIFKNNKVSKFDIV